MLREVLRFALLVAVLAQTAGTASGAEATVATYIDTFNRGGWTAQGNAGYHPPGWTYNGPPSDTAWGGTYCDVYDSYAWPYSSDQYGHRGYKHSKQLNPASLPDANSNYEWWIYPRIPFDPDDFATMGEIDWNYPVHFEADANGTNMGDASVTWRSYVQLLPGYTHSSLEIHDWPHGTWEAKTLRSTLAPGQGAKGAASLEIATNYRIPPGHTNTAWSEVQWDSLRMLYTPVCPGLQSIKLYRGTTRVDVLNANDTTEYKVQAMVTHPDGGAAVGDIRVLFDFTPGNPATGRGYLCWGQTDADVTYHGNTWQMAAAAGGGRWGICTNTQGGLTYIAATGCTTWTSVQQRWVEFTFRVKPAWGTTGPASGNWISLSSRKAGSSSSSNWHHSYGDPWYGKSDVATGYFSIERSIYSTEMQRWGTGVAGQNMVDGSWTTRLWHFEGYRPDDAPWNPLGVGWYQDWNWTTGPIEHPASGQTIEYLPLVGGWGAGVRPSMAQIQAQINAYPEKYPDGTTWFIGNEICFDDTRTPEQYARDFHEFSLGLKSINPTFQVCVGAIITSIVYPHGSASAGFSGTPVQLAQAIWDAHRSVYGTNLPADAWCIHPYAWYLSTTCEQLANFDAQLNQFRDWMQSVGQQEKPLIIKEYGLLEYHNEDRMVDYLLGSFDILLGKGYANGMQADGGRRVQRWCWFNNNNYVWYAQGPVQSSHCGLYNGDSWDMRSLGYAYRQHPKRLVDTLTVLANTITSPRLVNSDAAEYGVTMVVEDPSNVSNILSVRAMFFLDAEWQPQYGRGFLAWAVNDAEFVSQGGTWHVMGNATGGGRWAYRTDAWGSNTYITPLSCSTSTCGKRRTVTFRFRVKPAWNPASGLKILCFTNSTGNPGLWALAPQRYAVQANASPTFASNTISATTLLADDSTQYKVVVKATDANGVDDLRDVRVMLHSGGAFTSDNARGYLCWGLTDADIRHYDATWTIVGNAEGGGRWGWNNGGWGRDTYITPVSAVMNTYLNEHTITFTFKVRPAWAQASNQKMRALSRDASHADSGWVESSDNYDVRTNAAPTIISNTLSASTLVADNANQYTITLTANDSDGVADIVDMRILLDDGIYATEHGRGHMVWGLTDADIQFYGGEWFLKGDATGGGRWALRKNGYGSDTYITPVSCTTSTSGSQRTVVFAFTVKPAWAPAADQVLRGFVRDVLAANWGWNASPIRFSVVAPTATPTRTPSPSPSNTPPNTPMNTPTSTPTTTRTPTRTSMPSATPTFTPTFSLTPTSSPTFTPTLSYTPSDTPTSAADLDDDALPDSLEGYPPVSDQTNRLLPDSDGDGLGDGVEDANRNGQRDAGETNGRDRDSDDDGLMDGVETSILGSDPLHAGSPAGYVDSDGDGLPAGADPLDLLADADGDRFKDGYEAAALGLSAAFDDTTRPPLGDLNRDGAISNVDALMVQSLFLGIVGPEFPAFAGVGYRYSDANRDGQISNVDALVVQSFFLTLVGALP